MSATKKCPFCQQFIGNKAYEEMTTQRKSRKHACPAIATLDAETGVAVRKNDALSDRVKAAARAKVNVKALVAWCKGNAERITDVMMVACDRTAPEHVRAKAQASIQSRFGYPIDFEEAYAKQAVRS